jgi:hypothetical protein
LLVLAVPVVAFAACVVEVDHRHPSGTQPVGSSTTTPTTTPLLVTVDTDKTMNAAGGDGVGVFIEYKAGGTWHVWVTCDTNKHPTAPPCNFDIKATAASGAIKNIQADRLLQSDKTTQNADGSLEMTTVTATNVAGVFFDTDPGARITINATLAGVDQSGDYLFFVQDGKVNGGYMGTVTNPLELEPSAP